MVLRLVLTTILIAPLGCKTVPVTGRKQLRLIPESVMQQLGRTTFQSTVQAEPVERGTRDAKLVREVGARIARRSRSDRDIDWNYALFESPQVNAWALPGGYIGIYDGILPVLQNEAGLAFVMAHEVGHVRAHHGAERMSQQLAVTGGLLGLQAWISGQDSLSTDQKQIVYGALGLGSQLGVLLPFSRKHEKEADVIGLMMMAEAGYPPEESLGVWRRMGNAGGERPPVFLSTHPSPEGRIQHLRSHMKTARKKYRRHALRRDTTSSVW